MTYDPGKCDQCGRALTKKERLYGLCRICAEVVRAGVLSTPRRASPKSGRPWVPSTRGAEEVLHLGEYYNPLHAGGPSLKPKPRSS